MAQKTRNELMQRFLSGMKPTQEDFKDVFDSCYNILGDGDRWVYYNSYKNTFNLTNINPINENEYNLKFANDINNLDDNDMAWGWLNFGIIPPSNARRVKNINIKGTRNFSLNPIVIWIWARLYTSFNDPNQDVVSIGANYYSYISLPFEIIDATIGLDTIIPIPEGSLFQNHINYFEINLAVGIKKDTGDYCHIAPLGVEYTINSI